MNFKVQPGREAQTEPDGLSELGDRVENSRLLIASRIHKAEYLREESCMERRELQREGVLRTCSGSPGMAADHCMMWGDYLRLEKEPTNRADQTVHGAHSGLSSACSHEPEWKKNVTIHRVKIEVLRGPVSVVGKNFPSLKHVLVSPNKA